MTESEQDKVYSYQWPFLKARIANLPLLNRGLAPVLDDLSIFWNEGFGEDRNNPVDILRKYVPRRAAKKMAGYQST